VQSSISSCATFVASPTRKPCQVDQSCPRVVQVGTTTPQGSSNAKAWLRLFDLKDKVQEQGKQVLQKGPCPKVPMSRAKVLAKAFLQQQKARRLSAANCATTDDAIELIAISSMSRPIEPLGASCLRRVVVSVVSVASSCPLCPSLLSCLLCPSRRPFVGPAGSKMTGPHVERRVRELTC
jgi:hypothetical protein